MSLNKWSKGLKLMVLATAPVFHSKRFSKPTLRRLEAQSFPRKNVWKHYDNELSLHALRRDHCILLLLGTEKGCMLSAVFGNTSTL